MTGVGATIDGVPGAEIAADAAEAGIAADATVTAAAIVVAATEIVTAGDRAVRKAGIAGSGRTRRAETVTR